MKRLAFTLLLVGAAASAAPLPTRDQNPLLAGFGLPMPAPASLSNERWSFSVDFNWGSTALVQASGNESLIIDAETRVMHFTIRRTLADRFALQLQIPWRHIGAGSLDGFIDDWHDVFGLPEGARPMLADDQLHIVYTRNGAALIDIESPQSGVGDISVDLGYPLHSTSQASATAWLSLKLPTGEAASLTGSEAPGASFIAAGEQRFGERGSVFAQASVSWAGAELLTAQQRRIVWSGMAGMSWRAFQPLELKIQIDVHSATFNDSDLDSLNESMALTVGGSLHFDSGWRLDLGVSEDLAVETAPDVVFVLGIRRGH